MRRPLGTPVAAGALTAFVTGGVMAVLASTAGGLAASMPAIAGLTALLVVAGVVYGWLVQTEQLRPAFGPGIVYWSIAFPAARLIFELVAGDPDSRGGLSNGLMGFLVYQAMVGAAFGLGFILLHNQVSILLDRQARRRELPQEPESSPQP
jgi:hypothetical protein